MQVPVTKCSQRVSGSLSAAPSSFLRPPSWPRGPTLAYLLLLGRLFKGPLPPFSFFPRNSQPRILCSTPAVPYVVPGPPASTRKCKTSGPTQALTQKFRAQGAHMLTLGKHCLRHGITAPTLSRPDPPCELQTQTQRPVGHLLCCHVPGTPTPHVKMTSSSSPSFPLPPNPHQYLSPRIAPHCLAVLAHRSPLRSPIQHDP